MGSPSVVFLDDEDFSRTFKESLDELVANYQFRGGGASMNRITGTDSYTALVEAQFVKTKWYSGRTTDSKYFNFYGTILLDQEKQAKEEVIFWEITWDLLYF